MRAPEDVLLEGAVEAHAAGETLWLLPQLAAWWPRERTLLVADAHLGKAAAFRHAGVPVPSGTTGENLDRLSALIDGLDAQRVAFLGDLVHNRAAVRAAGAAFVRWREHYASVEMLLVRGNHDKHAGDLPCEWGLTCLDEPHAIGGLALSHHPQPAANGYAIAGHLHPSAQLVGRGREFIRLPCFFFGREFAILPAFGEFTGMADVRPEPGDRVYVVADDHVFCVSPE